MKHYGSFFTFLFLLISANIEAQTINVKITDIRSEKGNIILSVFRDQESFSREKPARLTVIPKTELQKGSLTTHINNLNPGIYGIALLDDENGNGKMDYRLLIPQEGFGFSDYYSERLVKPVFEDFSFNLESEDRTVNIRLRYINIESQRR